DEHRGLSSSRRTMNQRHIFGGECSFHRLHLKFIEARIVNRDLRLFVALGFIHAKRHVSKMKKLGTPGSRDLSNRLTHTLVSGVGSQEIELARTFRKRIGSRLVESDSDIELTHIVQRAIHGVESRRWGKRQPNVVALVHRVKRRERRSGSDLATEHE